VVLLPTNLSAAACGQTDVSSRPPRAPHCPPPEVEPCNALLVGLRSTRRTARPPTVPPSSGCGGRDTHDINLRLTQHAGTRTHRVSLNHKPA